MTTGTQNTIKLKIEAMIPLPEKQEVSSANPPCSSGCGGGKCGGCGKSETPLSDAGEKLLELAASQYTLEQLSTALHVIEALLKRHYSKQ